MKSSIRFVFVWLLANGCLAQVGPTIPPKAYSYADFPESEGADHGSAEFWTKESFDLVDDFLKQYMVKN